MEIIEKAVKGAYGVFSVQKHDGNAAEQGTHSFFLSFLKDKFILMNIALNLVEASKKAGVNVFIQTTVASTGRHFSFPGYLTLIHFKPFISMLIIN